MKICFYSASRSPLDILQGATTDRGGAEKQIAHLAKALAERGHEVYLLYSDEANNKHEPPDKISGVYCIKTNLETWKHPGEIFTFWRQLKQIDPEIIYARLPDDFLWLLSLFARLHKRAKFVYALANDAHCNPWHTYRYNAWFHNPLYALGLYTAHVVLTQHEGQQPLVRPYTFGKIRCLPNLMHSSVKQRREYKITDFDAIWIAQIRPQKQIVVFLDLVERLPHLHFALVGGFNHTLDEPTQAALKARIRELPNLEYLGLQKPNEAMRLLARSKVLVNTSSEEGFPNTMLEAWSVGVPVVSLTVDPGRVIVDNGLGLVSGNTARLCQDVERLARVAALNHQLGDNGMVYVQKNHGRAVVLAAFEQVMSE